MRRLRHYIAYLALALAGGALASWPVPTAAEERPPRAPGEAPERLDAPGLPASAEAGASPELRPPRGERSLRDPATAAGGPGRAVFDSLPPEERQRLREEMRDLSPSERRRALREHVESLPREERLRVRDALRERRRDELAEPRRAFDPARNAELRRRRFENLPEDVRERVRELGPEGRRELRERLRVARPRARGRGPEAQRAFRSEVAGEIEKLTGRERDRAESRLRRFQRLPVEEQDALRDRLQWVSRPVPKWQMVHLEPLPAPPGNPHG